MLPHSSSLDHHIARPRRSLRSRPQLDALEDRRLLTTFNTLASAADGSANSLRAAILLANANGQNNTINLQGGTYQLSIPNGLSQENSAARGDVDLTDAGHSITIEGAGAGVTTIDGGALDRVFQVLPGVAAIIRDLTIQNGVARDDGTNGDVQGLTDALGGGILNQGTLELDNVVIQNCRAVGADGLTNADTQVDATGKAAWGGAIDNASVLTLNGCLLTDNLAVSGTSGDYQGLGQDGSPALGGGIQNNGTMTVNESAIVFNTARGGAGGAAGYVAFSAGLPGGQGGYALGGGLFGSAPETRIVDSTVAGNVAAGGAGGSGGRGFSDGAVGLDGGRGGDSGGAGGGGIGANTPIELFNSTIVRNQTEPGTAGVGGPGGFGFEHSGKTGMAGNLLPDPGGGVWAPVNAGNMAYLTAISTIIALNTTSDNFDPDVDGTFGYVDTTIVGMGDGATGVLDGVNGNFVGVDPMLGPLQNNGGPTPTVALLSGSLAINNGSNPLGLTADQRGYTPRAAGGAPDIGAFEVGATAPSSGGGGVTPLKITVKTVKVKGAREIEVFNAGTNVLRFAVYPFGKSYRGTFQVIERDVNHDGVLDVIAERRAGRKLVSVIFNGRNGAVLGR